MRVNLTGRVGLVTGSSRGIGRGIALKLAENGASVVVNFKQNETAANEAVSQIESLGRKSIVVRADLTKEREAARLIKAAEQEFGRLDILVNNVGSFVVKSLADTSTQDWHNMLDSNLSSILHVCKNALPGMRKRSFGRIVNIGSIHSLVASPYKSAYVSAKHGLLGFSKVIALETAETDITINTICPSYVKTPLVNKQIANQAKEHGISEDQVIHEIMLKPMPKRSFVTIAELYGIVEFLVSDSARNVTGQAITVDGGWTLP